MLHYLITEDQLSETDRGFKPEPRIEKRKSKILQVCVKVNKLFNGFLKRSRNRMTATTGASL